MRRSGEIESKKASSVKVALAGFLIMVLLLPGLLTASEKKAGNVLVLKMKDGQTGKGELLAVKGDRLILMDSDTQTDANIQIHAHYMRIPSDVHRRKSVSIRSL